MNFPEQLRAARKAAKLTQAAADLVLETCKGQVAAWESARNTPHVLTQQAALARLKPFAYVWQNPDFSDTSGGHVAGSDTPETDEREANLVGCCQPETHLSGMADFARGLERKNDGLKKAISSALLELYPPARSAMCRRILRAAIGEDPDQIHNNERPERESETSVYDECARSPSYNGHVPCRKCGVVHWMNGPCPENVPSVAPAPELP